ncbi:MAG TPA: VOC family protein [Gemmatimonadaceae bacterium]|nr:VOC family protein [Gemmatimonadaceae bacterium]
MPELLSKVDHLVFAVPDLDRGMGEMETLLGVRATPGGVHPGRGTRNALIRLGPGTYLEIVAPDPDQPEPPEPRWFGVDTGREARLATWAAKSTDLERLHGEAAAADVGIGETRAGSRRRTDGVMLSWRFTDPGTVAADGIVPFFIDWGRSPHPAQTLSQGAALAALRAEHPDAPRVTGMLRSIGLDLSVTKGAHATLVAVIDGRRGRVELRN